jgi:hypothetical protein
MSLGRTDRNDLPIIEKNNRRDYVETTLRGALFASASIVCAVTAPASAQAAAQTRTFAIPAQSAETAIGLLGHQANVQIIASRKVTHAVRTNAVRGA